MCIRGSRTKRQCAADHSCYIDVKACQVGRISTSNTDVKQKKLKHTLLANKHQQLNQFQICKKYLKALIIAVLTMYVLCDVVNTVKSRQMTKIGGLPCFWQFFADFSTESRSFAVIFSRYDGKIQRLHALKPVVFRGVQICGFLRHG